MTAEQLLSFQPLPHPVPLEVRLPPARLMGSARGGGGGGGLCAGAHGGCAGNRPWGELCARPVQPVMDMNKSLPLRPTTAPFQSTPWQEAVELLAELWESEDPF